MRLFFPNAAPRGRPVRARAEAGHDLLIQLVTRPLAADPYTAIASADGPDTP